MKKQLRVGFDLDGVLLYNPIRITRPIISFFKKLFFKKNRLKFYVPKKAWEKSFWKIFHKSSIFIAPGLNEIKILIKANKIQAYIITARYSFLKDDLKSWLKNMGVEKSFSGIYFNEKDEQPHLFKEKLIKKLNLDIFVEDNLDIVSYLKPKFDGKKIKIFWIYNIFDKNYYFANKFPNLRSAIIRIKKLIA